MMTTEKRSRLEKCRVGGICTGEKEGLLRKPCRHEDSPHHELGRHNMQSCLIQ
ncbi:hypothetical protein PAMP_013233 [Pampus punctatissimus]